MRKIGLALACVVAVAGCSDVARVRRGLESPEWQVRYGAAADLHLLRADEKTTPLLLGAMGDPAPRVRGMAAQSLRLMLDRGGADAIFAGASQQPERVRKELVSALADRGVPDSAVPFLTQMLGSNSPDERLAAAKVFSGVQTPDKVETLLAAWRRDPEPQVRVAALASAAYPPPSAKKDKQVLEAYEAMIAGSPELLREPPLLAAVGDLRLASATHHLLGMIVDPELRYIAIESLGKIKSEAAAAPLLELLEQNESWVMNRQVCRALECIRTPEVGAKLAELFLQCKPSEDRDSWDRTAFITLAMLKTGGDDVFETFVSQLTNDELRDFALYGIHRMTLASVVHPENRWLYSWPTMQEKWREWWKLHRDEVARRLAEDASWEDY